MSRPIDRVRAVLAAAERPGWRTVHVGTMAALMALTGPSAVRQAELPRDVAESVFAGAPALKEVRQTLHRIVEQVGRGKVAALAAADFGRSGSVEAAVQTLPSWRITMAVNDRFAALAGPDPGGNGWDAAWNGVRRNHDHIEMTLTDGTSGCAVVPGISSTDRADLMGGLREDRRAHDVAPEPEARGLLQETVDAARAGALCLERAGGRPKGGRREVAFSGMTGFLLVNAAAGEKNADALHDALLDVAAGGLWLDGPGLAVAAQKFTDDKRLRDDAASLPPEAMVRLGARLVELYGPSAGGERRGDVVGGTPPVPSSSDLARLIADARIEPPAPDAAPSPTLAAPDSPAEESCVADDAGGAGASPRYALVGFELAPSAARKVMAEVASRLDARGWSEARFRHDAEVTESAAARRLDAALERAHPALAKGSAKVMAARRAEAARILGDGETRPVRAVFCWKPEPGLTAGTAAPLLLARSGNVPVVNLGDRRAASLSAASIADNVLGGRGEFLVLMGRVLDHRAR